MIRVILVGTEGEINLGFIVRLCRNFDVDELILVKPQIDPFSDEVRRFAANGAIYIDSGKVKIYENLDDALRGIGISGCTSSVIDVDGGDIVRKAIELEEFANIASKYSSIAVVFGRESVGLTREEISKCDFLVHIASNPEYPVLNLSHAVAITLYMLYKVLRKHSLFDRIEPAQENELRILEKYIDEIVNIVASDEKQRESFSLVFKRFIRRTTLSRAEVGLLTTFIRRIYNKIRVR
ncbi:tRNA/rRNA methyltransferase (SpoU) [Ignisphaera aggregans DSM 17230]|uniref:tRNA/rRNA methyltransferase (SpoU) n=1 Tax=Ignisphaera aggregans (strain DSM 17230 / JCM 13409 / AQ1.S1) TaxID=583356 RepID=E0SNR4_IGNAA|nr:tRNA/rRNA methyltransferase (SpoU) [Ignisphaera aggregans DSM 17230]